MATQRLRMRQLREILRLHHDARLSHRAIARACRVGPTAVCEYLDRARRAGLGWPLPEDLDDSALEARLFPRLPGAASPRALPDVAYLHRELRRAGVTLHLLWLEYLQAQPDGYHYSQFCEFYRRFAARLNPSMRQVHRAGEKAFVDFSGKRPEIVDPRTGEVTAVELFVGVLGASSYIYAEATVSQELPCWIAAHVRMFEYWQGAPEILVPDNLKSGVTTPCRYEPAVNRTYAECAQHYGAVVIPARSFRAKDKAKVEVSVLLGQRWILAVLRNRTFFGLVELNTAIGECLTQLNARLMKQLGVSRRELFERLDRPALRPLPVSRYELAEWKLCRVNIDYHVELDHNFYSVPYALIRELVEARFTPSTVEVFFKSRRVTSHARLSGRGRYSTQHEHMPRSHQAHSEWSPSRLISWAEKTGPVTARVVAAVLASRPHPEQGYRSVLGIMRLGRVHGAERLEAACRRAERLHSMSYRTLNNILAAGLDRVPLEEAEEATSTKPLAAHENIRGADYYTPKEDLC